MSEYRPQVCLIHGGTVFESDDAAHHALEALHINYERLLYAPSWKNWLAEQLPDHDYFPLSMPNKFNAKYDDWALYFSKVVPLLRPDAVLIGHSLGGIFLAKYFTANPPAKSFRKLILIAAPYDDEGDESLNGFKLDSASSLSSVAHEINLFHSIDDPVVPFSEKDKYLRDLPEAEVHVFNDKRHFNESTFPELLDIVSR